MSRERRRTFFIWMRNGIAFFFTWIMLLFLIISFIKGIEVLPVFLLFQLLVFVTGGVLLFTLMFSDVVLRKLGFIERLTGFMLTFSIYEGICFYWLGLFQERGSFMQWAVFAGIVVILYLLCIGIYGIYSKKREAAYTQALQDYQQKENKG